MCLYNYFVFNSCLSGLLAWCADGEVWEAGPPGVQWVIPALALVVVLLLLLLALVLYKYYSRPDKK